MVLVLAALLFAVCGLMSGTVAGPAAAQGSAQQSVAQRCFEHHRFGAEPVDVAKSADGRTVLAQTSWNWHDAIGCYLTLDDTALATLRGAPAPQSLPDSATEESRRCFEHHRFGQRPVDVAKSADRQTVLARLSWNWHDAIGCYLTLDDTALATLRGAPAHAPAVRVSFRSAASTWWEGSNPHLRMTLDKVPARTVTIPLTSSFHGGATAADFGTIPTSVTFAADETAKTVEFTIIDDGIDDSGESIQFAVGTTLPTNVVAGTTSHTTVNITDTGLAPVNVSFGSATYTAAEGSATQLRLILDQAPNRTVTIPLTSSFHGGATAADFGTLPTSVTFAPHETIKIVTFTVVGDGVGDSGESIRFAISTTLPARVTAWSHTNTTVTITDTGLTPVTVKFTSSTYAAAEGTHDQVILTLDKAPGRTVIIPLVYTFHGGATGADLVKQLPSLTFGPTDRSITLGIGVLDDGYVDPGESYAIAIGQSLPDGVAAGTPSQTTVNIADTGATPVKAKFNSSAKTATEGTTVHLALTLYRDPAYVVPAGGDVVLPLTYTFQGGATESDFGRLQTSATFDSITVTVYISISIVDDGIIDPGESLLVKLGGTLPDGFTHGTPSQVTVNITDTS